MSNAQEIIGLNDFLQADRIGLVDEFFSRFNGEQAHPSLPMGSGQGRKKNLMMLFDLSQFTSTSDPRFKNAEEMMDVVMAENITIAYPDGMWFALAHCLCKLDGKEIRLDVYLSVEQRRERMYKWVISKVEGSLLGVTAKSDSDMVMLYPDDHETNFMSLSRMTDEQPQDIEKFLSKGFSHNPTSVFAWLVFKGKLKISYVEDLEFVFTQIPGYLFRLKYFNRENSNSGWLISSFGKVDLETKDNILRSLSPDDIPLQFNANLSDVLETKMGNDTLTANTMGKTIHDLSHGEIFKIRTEERLSQLEDYLVFIQKKKETMKERRAFYCEKMHKLFDIDAKVFMKDAYTDCQSQMDISEFCRLLYEQSIMCLSIDSVSLPVWDNQLDTLGQDVETTRLPAYKRPFKAQKLNELFPSLLTLTDDTIAVFRERTETGFEWMPLLGNMIVTVKRNEIEQ